MVNDKKTKIKMIEQLHHAFERQFDKKSYNPPKYTQLQVLEKQIVWVGDVKDKLKDNPFLSAKAFDVELFHFVLSSVVLLMKIYFFDTE